MTLIELLVVIAIIGVLAALLLPTLSNAKASGKQASCLNNLKQSEMACQMYAADNGGKLVQNAAFASPFATLFNENEATNGWVYGNMKMVADFTNLSYVRNGRLFPLSFPPPPTTVRRILRRLKAGRGCAVTMNSWAGSSEMEMLEQQTGCRAFLKETDFAVPGPAGVWILIDEHAMTLSDGWFLVTMNNSEPFERFPATRHRNSYCLNFADGHAEAYHLRNPTNQVAETEAIAFIEVEPGTVLPTDPD